MMRARSARLRRVVAARTHVVSCARSSAATANFVATAMPSVHHTTTRMASELTRRDTSDQNGTGDRLGLFRDAENTIWGLPLIIANDGQVLGCAPAGVRDARI